MMTKSVLVWLSDFCCHGQAETFCCDPLVEILNRETNSTTSRETNLSNSSSDSELVFQIQYKKVEMFAAQQFLQNRSECYQFPF